MRCFNDTKYFAYYMPTSPNPLLAGATDKKELTKR